MLSSNVAATVGSGATLDAEGDITVRASTGGSEDQADKLDGRSDIKAALDKVKSQYGDKSGKVAGSAVRQIGVVAAGGGTAGVGVSLGALVVTSDVKAVLAGNVIQANNLNVKGEMHFDKVLSTVVSVAGGGAAGVAVSAGGAWFQGKVTTAIADNAKIGQKDKAVKSINITSTGETNTVSAVAGAAVGGTAGVAVNAALAYNKLDVDTYIGEGVKAKATGDITLSSDFDTTSDVWLVSAAGGLVGVGVGLVANIAETDSRTYIGRTPLMAAGEKVVAGSAATVKGKVETTGGSVSISDAVKADLDIYGIGIAAGGVAVNGLVVLGINRVKNIAAVNAANVDAKKNLSISTNLEGSNKIYATSVVAGAVGVGATVAVAYQGSESGAWIDTTDASIKTGETGAINLNAGTAAKPFASTAQTLVVTGAAGGVAAAVNFGIAVNASKNTARITGESGELSAGSVNIGAYGKTDAYSIIANAAVGAITANVSAAVANLKSHQSAEIDTAATMSLGDVTVKSEQNWNRSSYGSATLKAGDIGDKNDLTTQFNTMAEAYIFSASAGALSINANTAIATANAAGIAGVKGDDLTIQGNLTVDSKGVSKSEAKVDNLAVAAISVGLMNTFSYAAGRFESYAGTHSDGKLDVKGALNVNTEYLANANSEVNPAFGGISASLVNVGVNLAVAKVKTIAGAFTEGAGTIHADRALNVTAIGTATSSAVVKAAQLDLSGVSIAMNLTYADAGAKQNASVAGGKVEAASVTVLSSFNKDLAGAGATSVVGATAGPSATLSLASLKANASIAAITAEVISSFKADSANIGGDIDVKTEGTAFADADVLSPDVSLAGLNVAVNVMVAMAQGTFDSILSGGTGLNGIQAVNAKATTDVTVKAEAVGEAPKLDISY